MGVIAQGSLSESLLLEDFVTDPRVPAGSITVQRAKLFSPTSASLRVSLSPSAMTTPTQPQTPVSTPPVPHGVGNPGGTPVVAPTRSKDKDGAASGSLGTFGVRLFCSMPMRF